MTNHDRFVQAFRGIHGSKLSTQDIKYILKKRFPSMAEGSMLPNDHANGNKGACPCAGTNKRVFDRIGHALYEVR